MSGPYASSFGAYRKNGWKGVLPLPARRKKWPPKGYTGEAGDWPSPADMHQWATEYPEYQGGNIALRVPEYVIGIDVDAHSGKTGGATLTEAERRWDPLPPTIRSTSRTDGVSGIRLFRIPAGVRLRDRIQFAELNLGHIEIVQVHHRYVVAWPSAHEDTGDTYRWLDADGNEVGIPSPEDLPPLPDAWIKSLRADAASTGTTDAAEFLMGRGGARDWDAEFSSVREGGRDELFTEYAWHLSDTGIDAAAMTDLMRAQYRRLRDKRDFTEYDAVAKVDRALAKRISQSEQRAEAAVVEKQNDDGLTLLTPAALKTLTPAEPVIDKLLYRNTLVQLSGAPGSCKSFLALSWACAVAAPESQRQWESYPVRVHGPVLYVAAEGVNGLAARLEAWCEYHGLDSAGLNVHFHGDAVQLGDPEQVDRLLRTAVRIGAVLIVLDTRARCTDGLEENSATEQGKAIAAAEKVRQATGATVLVIHHSAKSGNGGGRGSNAWDGAVWSDLRINRDEGGTQLTVACHKHKDAEAGCRHRFLVQPFEVSAERLPEVPDKLRRTLLVVQNDPAAPTENGRLVCAIKKVLAAEPGRSQREVLAALRDAGEEDGGPQSGTQSTVRDTTLRGLLDWGVEQGIWATERGPRNSKLYSLRPTAAH